MVQFPIRTETFWPAGAESAALKRPVQFSSFSFDDSFCVLNTANQLTGSSRSAREYPRPMVAASRPVAHQNKALSRDELWECVTFTLPFSFELVVFRLAEASKAGLGNARVDPRMAAFEPVPSSTADCSVDPRTQQNRTMATLVSNGSGIEFESRFNARSMTDGWLVWPFGGEDVESTRLRDSA